RERSHVLGRQRETLAPGVVRQIAGRGQAAEPLSQVALVETGTLRELGRRRRSVRGELLEKTQPIAERGEQHAHRAAELLEELAGEGFLAGGIDGRVVLLRHGILDCTRGRGPGAYAAGNRANSADRPLQGFARCLGESA